MRKRREQLLETGMPHQQLDSVLAEFREQQIKAAKGTQAANSMAKKQGSVGQHAEAVAIASLAVAWGGRGSCCRLCGCRGGRAI